MILADTGIWVDHLRRRDPDMARLLEGNQVLGHPWVAGELALGHLAQRRSTLTLLGELPQALVADTSELATLIERDALHGRGIGYVDAQLLASTLLTPDTRLWTRDRRLAALAEDLGVAAVPPP